jgi:hypothetical protein
MDDGLFFITCIVCPNSTPPAAWIWIQAAAHMPCFCFPPALPQIQTLMDMGFARDSAEAALVASNDDVEEAVLYMLASIAPDVGASRLADVGFFFVWFYGVRCSSILGYNTQHSLAFFRLAQMHSLFFYPAFWLLATFPHHFFWVVFAPLSTLDILIIRHLTNVRKEDQ